MPASAALASALLQAVRHQDFGATPDAMRGGRPVAHFPSLELALAVFAPGRAPQWAHVLFSREFPQGVVGDAGPQAGAVRNVAYVADQRNEAFESFLWWPESDWSRVRFEPLAGRGPHRFVLPYPASLFKLLVAVGIAIGVDDGRLDWPAAAMEAMITVSSNDATTELVALLHRHALVAPLHARLAALGLPTLRLDGTQPDGGWGNRAGGGVGRLQMGAWDTLRLLWLLDADAPPPPWLPRGTRLVSDASRARLRGWLDAQGLHEILSSGVLAGVPGWVRGIPAAVPAAWIGADGGAKVGDETYPPDIRPENARAEVRFAHKTGTTENYGSDAGIVRGLAPRRRHYLVALVSNLGSRYSPGPPCATTWKLPALGAAIDGIVARLGA